MNIIENLEKEQIGKLTESGDIPDFGPGDTLKVDVKVREGSRERIQAFEGVCIARASKGVNSNFTVRKISYGEGVERVFPLFSPNIEKITVIRRGKVRRAKLYYLRGRTGKSARIAEKQDFTRVSKKDARAAARAEKEKPKAEKPVKETKAKKSAKEAKADKPAAKKKAAPKKKAAAAKKAPATAKKTKSEKK